MTNATLSAPALTADELATFAARGWLLKRGLFSREAMAALAVETEGLHERMSAHTPDTAHVSWEEGLPADRPQRIRQLMHSEVVSPILDAMSKSEAMLGVLRHLIGPDIYLFHSKLMMKAAHDGTFTPWHQDWGYWQYGSKRPTHINGMLAIDAADAENGAIRFVDGSHTLGAVDHRHFESTSFSIGLDGGIEDRTSTMVEMQPGDVIFFGPLVIHGSGPNRSARDRRANTFAYDTVGNQKGDPLPERWWRCGKHES